MRDCKRDATDALLDGRTSQVPQVSWKVSLGTQ